MRAARRVVTTSVLLAVFALAWLYRFNDPGGSFAGMTDDHFFYVVRGWQILFGELPVRDFVDHGAPLYFYVAAAVQELFGRGTLSEVAFSVTVLSIGAALTCWLAYRASGWLVLGIAAALFHVLLEPRFYNYPKVVVYAAGIPLLWWFADRPGAWPRALLAVVSVLAFLLRHDHGVFVAIGVAAMLLFLRELSVRERLRHAAIYALLVVLLLAPYLVFLQATEGIATYFSQAAGWAAKDRQRAPVVWPALIGSAEAPESGSPATLPSRALDVVRRNPVAWVYYVELALPFVALALLAISRDGFRPDWPRAAPKIATVAVLGMALNAGFLRSPLPSRLADPSVPHAILIAWLAAATARLLITRDSLRPGAVRAAIPLRVLVVAIVTPIFVVASYVIAADFHERRERAAFVERPGKPFERAAGVIRQLRQDWMLLSWTMRPERPDLINLSLYLNACTRPDDRIFVQAYMPQVLALARRGFAGGHADLRPGFFTTVELQEKTLARLQRQSVPIALLESQDEYRNFRRSFPLVAAYLDRHYELAGTRVFDRRFAIQLFVRKDLQPTGRYEPFDWPCFWR